MQLKLHVGLAVVQGSDVGKCYMLFLCRQPYDASHLHMSANGHNTSKCLRESVAALGLAC